MSRAELQVIEELSLNLIKLNLYIINLKHLFFLNLENQAEEKNIDKSDICIRTHLFEDPNTSIKKLSG